MYLIQKHEQEVFILSKNTTNKLDEIFTTYESNKDKETIRKEWKELELMKETFGIDIDIESVFDDIAEITYKSERRGFFNGFQYATELWIDLMAHTKKLSDW